LGVADPALASAAPSPGTGAGYLHAQDMVLEPPTSSKAGRAASDIGVCWPSVAAACRVWPRPRSEEGRISAACPPLRRARAPILWVAGPGGV